MAASFCLLSSLHGSNFKLHSPIVRTAFFGVISVNGHGFPIAFILQSFFTDSFRNEVVGNGFCAVFGKTLVVAVGAFAIGVSPYLYAHVGIGF